MRRECDENAEAIAAFGHRKSRKRRWWRLFCVRNACTARIKEMKVEIPKNRKNSVKKFSKEFSKANHRVCVSMRQADHSSTTVCGIEGDRWESGQFAQSTREKMQRWDNTIKKQLESTAGVSQQNQKTMAVDRARECSGRFKVRGE